MNIRAEPELLEVLNEQVAPLLSSLEEERAARRAAEETSSGLRAENEWLQETIAQGKQLQKADNQRIAKLEEALRFYSDEKNYESVEREGTAYQSNIDADVGTTARAALRAENETLKQSNRQLIDINERLREAKNLRDIFGKELVEELRALEARAEKLKEEKSEYVFLAANLSGLLREARKHLPNPSFSDDCLVKRIDAALGEGEKE